MRTSTTIPAVMTYLFERLGQRLNSDISPEMLVTYGHPAPPMDATPDILCLGFTGIPGEPVIENVRQRQQAATSPDRETYELTCLASSYRGNETDLKVVTDSAFAIVDSVTAFLAQDHTMGGLVMRSRVMTDAVAPEQTEEGAIATIRFVIQIDAFTG